MNPQTEPRVNPASGPEHRTAAVGEASTTARADFARLAPGDTFELRAEPITTQQLVRYAGASGDYNRIHYDQTFAVEAGLGGVIAHGMLTMALMGRAATDWAGPRGRVARIAARFSAPVRPGDVVRVVGRVVATGRVDDTGRVECRLEADVDGRAVAAGDAVVLLPLDAAEAEATR
jgi:acyl dehydratase